MSIDQSRKICTVEIPGWRLQGRRLRRSELDQNQGRKPHTGFGCALTGRSRRGVVRASRVLISIFGAAALLFSISCVGWASAKAASGSNGPGGTHGTSVTIVLGGG